MAVSVAVVVILGSVIWYVLAQKNTINSDSSRSEAVCHTVPREVSSIGTYEVPCTVTVTMMQYGQTVNEADERSRLQELIKTFDATIRDDSLPDIGVYYLDVAPGTENKIIEYLKSQKGVNGANREYGCVYKCIGPN